VLQKSVLGPVLILLYTADVIVIAQQHGFLALSYAVDIQLYFHDEASSVETRLRRLKDCIIEIDRWMSSNHLLLNADETVLMAKNEATTGQNSVSYY